METEEDDGSEDNEIYNTVVYSIRAPHRVSLALACSIVDNDMDSL